MSNKLWEDAYLDATVQKSMRMRRSASDLQCQETQTILNTLIAYLVVPCHTSYSRTFTVPFSKQPPSLFVVRIQSQVEILPIAPHGNQPLVPIKDSRMPRLSDEHSLSQDIP